MSRVAASLSYLVIYNATLRAPESTQDDDEDAQENAQILFYTASERAVSRDRMLRQVGLARALVNFTETFAGGAACENVHAQGKRMIMVSPESDYWLHASVAVAKTPRPVKAKAGEPSSPSSPLMQHHEHSVHDAALRAHLLRGYEDFKLLHGTFSSILVQPNGRQTLERQLERFFTVWAWRWDVESSDTLRDHLGVPTHPLSKALLPVIEEHCAQLPENSCVVVASSSNVVSTPSTSGLPQSLLRHLMLLSPAPAPTPVAARVVTTRRSRLNSKAASAGKGGTMGFFTNTLHMPSVSMGSMDMTKWNWSGYLTFGAKGSTASTSTSAEKATMDNAATQTPTVDSAAALVPAPAEEQEPRTAPTAGSRVQVQAEVDSKSLLDALGDEAPDIAATEDTTPTGPTVPVTAPLEAVPCPDPDPDPAAEAPTSSPVPTPSSVPLSDIGSSHAPPLPPPVETAAKQQPDTDDIVDSPIQTALAPQVEFSSFTAFLPTPGVSQLARRKVYYLSSDGFTAAVVWPPSTTSDSSPFERTDDIDVAKLVPHTVKLLHDLRAKADGEPAAQSQVPAGKPVPTQHLLALRDGTTSQSSSGFNSTSSYFFDCEHMLDVDAESEEVFSRTTNPARWFVVHRGEGGTTSGANLYLEDSRKEASLVDVADEVTTVRRRYAL